ncbi:MAG TPA: branched-chain amino acid ABC transporter permease [Fastidiosipila sp.]|jgi:branched-chain amino acid transport system permease protein|nr:branched-chain amino acid ABC transporter permease [Fastidiosipila sp.]
MSEFFGIILRSLEYGSIYALASLSIILVFRTSFTTNFAQGMIAMFSTYFVATLIHKSGLPLGVAFVLGLIFALLLGFLIDIIVIRRAAKLSPVGKQIITLGVLSIILGLTPNIFGVYDLNMPKFIPQGDMKIAGTSISYNALLNIGLGLLVMLTLYYVLHRTKAGLAIRTTAENAPVARLMGVSTKLVTMFAWGVAGCLSLLAGMMASPFSQVSTTFMNDIQITAFLACLLGGFTTFFGAVAGSYIIAIASNLLQVYLPQGTVWGKPILYILLIGFLFLKPFGLFGKRYVKKV